MLYEDLGPTTVGFQPLRRVFFVKIVYTLKHPDRIERN